MARAHSRNRRPGTDGGGSCLLVSLVLLTVAGAACGPGDAPGAVDEQPRPASDQALRAEGEDLDEVLRSVLQREQFTGTIESQLERRLGRPLDPVLAEVGRLLFFDPILALHGDNSCAGCHAPAFGFGDSQRMAIGVDNNGVVGPNRRGPRNQRRSPPVPNTEFYPALMWTPRFVALSFDPFDSPRGFQFPPPENVIRDREIKTLLQAQASLPSTELVEMAGFTGITENPGPFGPRHFQFDDGHGEELPAPDRTGFHNFPIQDRVDARLNATIDYLWLFGQAFNGGTPLRPGEVTINMRRLAIAEFQMSLPGADAPIDRYARGDDDALTEPQKRGALLFFGKARCVECHAVAGSANEMFSDFREHRIGVPQVFPTFGVGTGNTIFDGPGEDEDFGFEQTTGDPARRYTFRTAPLRNVGAVAPGWFHNGSAGSLTVAIEHHLDVLQSARSYDPRRNDLPPDLFVGPIEPVLAAGIDPLLASPIALTNQELRHLEVFVREALLDERVLEFCELVPRSLPSGMPVALFEGCEEQQLE